MHRENLKIKTIKIELLEGTPNGFRRAEYTTQLVRVLVVPRDRLELLKDCPEKDFKAVYMIVGNDENGDPKVYIGLTGRIALRGKEHGRNNNRSFGKDILYFITKDNSLSTTEIEYLEWLLIKEASESGEYKVDNRNRGRRAEPHVEPARKADFIDYYNQIAALTEVLGHGEIFNKIHSEEEKSSEERFTIESSGKGINAELANRDDGFYVLAGSVCASELTETGKKNPFIISTREKLLKNGVLKNKSGKLTFEKDHKFKTPSGAASIVNGTNTNGWVAWKNKSGKTLDECLR